MDYQRRIIVTIAKAQLGKRYRWGASGPDEMDCSGLNWYTYLLAGFPLPRDMFGQYYKLHPAQEPQLGDMVFFITYGKSISHSGIYIGDGKFINAPSPGTVVRIDSLKDQYWIQRFVGARSPF